MAKFLNFISNFYNNKSRKNDFRKYENNNGFSSDNPEKMYIDNELLIDEGLYNNTELKINSSVKCEEDFNKSIFTIPLDFIQHLLLKAEKENKNSQKLLNIELENKNLEIENFIYDIKKKVLNQGEMLSNEDLSKIKSYAITKGGFLKMEYRRELYKIILCVNSSLIKRKNETIWINQNDSSLYYLSERLYQSKKKSFHF